MFDDLLSKACELVRLTESSVCAAYGHVSVPSALHVASLMEVEKGSCGRHVGVNVINTGLICAYQSSGSCTVSLMGYQFIYLVDSAAGNSYIFHKELCQQRNNRPPGLFGGTNNSAIQFPQKLAPINHSPVPTSVKTSPALLELCGKTSQCCVKHSVHNVRPNVRPNVRHSYVHNK